MVNVIQITFSKLILHKALLRAVRDYACLASEFEGDTPSFVMTASAKPVSSKNLETFQAAY
jgi:hypothetical protein